MKPNPISVSLAAVLVALAAGAGANAADWGSFVPPPVRDADNVLKAPHMEQWFVGTGTNELTQRIAALYRAEQSTELARITVLPPSANAAAESAGADIALRWFSPGKAVFLADGSDAGEQVAMIDFDDVPWADAVRALGRQIGLRLNFDPSSSGMPPPRATFNARWRNVAPRAALVALLDNYSLQLLQNPGASAATLVPKAPGAPAVDAVSPAGLALTRQFKEALGPMAVSPTGDFLLTQPLTQIKPVRIVVYAELTPDARDLEALLAPLMPGFKNWTRNPMVESAGANLFRLKLKAFQAAEFVAASDRVAPDLEAMRAACQRPRARPDGDYRNSVEQPTLNFVALRVVCQLLAARAQCHLMQGESSKAFEDLTLVDQLACLLTAYPTRLASAVLCGAVHGLYAARVAEGIQNHQWGDPELAGLQAQLEKIDLPPCTVLAIRAEVAGFCHWLRAGKIRQFEKNEKLFLNDDLEMLNPILARLETMSQSQIVELTDLVSRSADERVESFHLKYGRIAPTGGGPGSPLWADREPISSPDELGQAIQRGISLAAFYTGRNQTAVDQTALACALERFRVAGGRYPESLGALTPRYTPKIPNDIISGRPMVYRRLDDGRFLLYSVGWNGKDDGGDATNDWVWSAE